MNRKSRQCLCLLVFVMMGLWAMAQNATTETPNAVPSLINYSGVLKDSAGRTLNSITGVTFLIYKDEQSGPPLWLETQNVTPDRSGHYTVQLGATSAHGLPADIFQKGEARWLALQLAGEAEQARVLLVAVPYALKAQDAETIGGLPPSAFVLAAPMNASSATANAATSTSSAPPPASSDVTTTGGTANTIPMFTTATNVQNSILTQTATTAVNVAGKLNHPATGTATTTAGRNSQPDDYVASVFNSGTSTAVAQTFQLQAEPANNDTTTASGTLSLLYGSGTAAPAETGFKISNKGLITFATGQTFPGTGDGTITGITTASGSGLAGGGTSGTLNMSIPAAGVTNTMLQNSSLTITAGSGLSGGGKTSLGGTVTLSIPNVGVTNAMLQNSSVTLNANTAGGLTTPGAMSLGSTSTIGLKPCSTNQFLQYSGSVWNCATPTSGTVTSVASGAGLAGGPITSSGTLSIATGGVSNAMLQNPSLTIAAGTGLTGGGSLSLGGTITLNLDTTKVPLLTSNNTFTTSQTINGTLTAEFATINGEVAIPAGIYNAINATSSGEAATTISGVATSSTGEAWGVLGETNSDDVNAYGVYGLASSTVGNTIGTYGQASSPTGVGVFGQSQSESATGQGYSGSAAGTWGDGGTTLGNTGVMGTADDGPAGYFANNSPNNLFTLWALSGISQNFPFYAAGTNGSCIIDSFGDLVCTGSVSGVTSVDGGKRTVAMAAIESPQNWFEDFGSSQLVNGVAVVTLDPDFIQTVNSQTNYKVFPVPNGDCEGLYVTNKTANSFEVRELGGGTSSITFDYRITVLRKNYENVRFADHTHDLDGAKKMQERMKNHAAHPAPASRKSPISANKLHAANLAPVPKTPVK
jgi:hypothetical protein